MRQLIILESVDLATLHAGRTLTLLVNGASIDLAVDRGRRARAVENGAAPPATTLTTQRGDCPYCEKKGLLLSSHIHQKHPGKAVPWLGPGGVKCPTCHSMFPSEQSLRIHRNNTHDKGKPKPGRKA